MNPIQSKRFFRLAISLLVPCALALAVFVSLKQTPVEAVKSNIHVCQAGIIAGLTSGPDAPLDLSGNLSLYVQRDLNFTGTLALKTSGNVIPLKGQGAGHGIDLVFYPPGGQPLFAHGALEGSIYECNGLGSGPLTGPNFGDQGDWVTRPPFIRVISGTIN